MHRHSRPHRPAITLAAAGALGLIAGGIAQAGPVTGSGVPIDTVQPSLGVTYLVRTQDPTNFADIGQVEAFGGSVVPGGFSVANGQLISIASNPALFSRIGNTYGGDGFTSFGLPNLSGRTATEAGSAPGLTPEALGTIMGAETTTLNVANLPPQPLRKPDGTTAIFGGGQPFSLQQPTLGLHYIIATQGAFPTAGTILPDSVPFLGEISLFVGNFAPAGWQFADGQMVAINTDPALFAILGTTFGGNGFTTFGLPDLRDRVAVGTGNGVLLGEMFGHDTDTLNIAQLPVGYPAALPPVPEPPALAILLTGLIGLIVAHRRLLSPLPRLGRGR
jgi:microcystin-dependent protein